MTDRKFDWIYSGASFFGAVSFGLMLGDYVAFIVGVLMFFCGGFFERGRTA